MGWFSLFFQKRAKLQPEAEFVLSMSESEIVLVDPKGETHTLAMGNLGTVVVETNDTGPWGMDVRWVLLDLEGKLGVAYPQGATGEQQVMDWLMTLPGFDSAAMTDAMRCTDNATFPVWKNA